MGTEIEMKTARRSCSRVRNNTSVALTHIVFETRLNSLKTTEGRLMASERVTAKSGAKSETNLTSCEL